MVVPALGHNVKNAKKRKETKVLAVTIMPIAVTKETVVDRVLSCKSHGTNSELLLVFNNTSESSLDEFMDRMDPFPFNAVHYPDKFNLNGCYNYGMAHAHGADLFHFANGS